MYYLNTVTYICVYLQQEMPASLSKHIIDHLLYHTLNNGEKIAVSKIKFRFFLVQPSNTNEIFHVGTICPALV